MKRYIPLFYFLPLVSCIENALFKKDSEESSPQPVLEPAADPSEPETSAPTNEPESSEPESSPESNQPSYEPEPEPEPEQEPSNEPSSRPGEEEANPRTPTSGELVINEIMIDPDSIQDKYGEWLEVWNATGDWLTLEGFRIQDDNLDDYEIQSVDGSFVVEPGGYFLICAEENYWNNGGVDCHATFLYKTLGGGFALSNSDDEISLVRSNGQSIDRFVYGEGFAPVGASMGVRAGYESASANNDPSNWCEQWSFMSSGDAGSPGEENFCF